MTAWMAWLLALPALVALSLAMEQNHEKVCAMPVARSAQWLWRAVGAALLLLSLALCLQTWGASVAIAAWLGVLTMAALSVVLLLTYAAAHLRAVAIGSLLVGLGVWVVM